MKTFTIASVLPFLMITFFSISKSDLTVEEPKTQIVTIIDDDTKIVQIFDDGYDCTIFLNAEGDFIGSYGKDC